MIAAHSTTRSNRSSLLTPLIVIATLVAGILAVVPFHPAGAQSCSLMGPTTCSNMQCSATVYNSDFMHDAMCTLTMATGADCMPATTTLNGLSSAFLVGTGTTVTNPRCAWRCCGTTGFVDMDMTDGLPVELMEFSVEGEEEDAI